MSNKKQQIAVIFCGHGSRNKEYKKSFLSFKNKIKRNLNKFDYFHCFIEIDEPSIEKCLSEVVQKYKKILFFPLLLFNGDHFEEDVKKKIKTFNNLSGNRIILLKKLSLRKEIISVYKNIIQSYIKKDFNNYLVTSCSVSKTLKVRNELEKYTNLISRKIKFSWTTFCQFGEEEKVLSELNVKLNKNTFNLILHPIYLFDGFLYKNVCNKFKKKFKKINILEPLSNNKEILELVQNKLLGVN